MASQDKDKTEFGLTIAAIPVNILILILAGYFTRKEWMLGMIAIIVSLRLGYSQLEPDDMADPLFRRPRLLLLQIDPHVPTQQNRRAVSLRP